MGRDESHGQVQSLATNSIFYRYAAFGDRFFQHWIFGKRRCPIHA